MSLNRATLLGNVVADPQIRYVDSRPCADMRLATSEPARTAPNGAVVPEMVEYHRLVAWDRTAQLVEKYVRKGTKIYVEGKLRTRTWEDRNTIKHTVTEIYIDKLELLSRN